MAANIPVIRVLAPHMRAAAAAFRSDFTENYLATGTPYPILKGLQATQLRPNSDAARRLLLARGVLSISGGVIQNDEGSSVEADFEPVINNQPFLFSVLFPKPFRSTITFVNDELSANFVTAIPVTFVSKPNIPGAGVLLPDSGTLTGFSLSEASLIYQLADPSGSPFLFVNDFGQTSDYRLLRSSLLKNLSGNSEGIRLLDGGSCGGGGGGGTSPSTYSDDATLDARGDYVSHTVNIRSNTITVSHLTENTFPGSATITSTLLKQGNTIMLQVGPGSYNVTPGEYQHTLNATITSTNPAAIAISRIFSDDPLTP